MRSLAETIHFPNVDTLLTHGKAALDELRQLEILIGARSAS
jgi:hypothetical protein